MRMHLLSAALLAAVLAPSAMADAVNQVDYGSLTGSEIITFDDPGLAAANYDTTFRSNDTTFAERFVGQTLSYSGNSDVLSGAPGAPLTAQVGASDRNLAIVFNAGTNVLAGLGHLGYPDADAIGEGSFSVLFDYDQSQFGFQLVGGDQGSATIDFYNRSGGLIDSISLTGLTNAYYGFSRQGGVKDIAGISLYNLDGGGIGFDNLKHDVPGNPGGPPSVPEPSTVALALVGVVGAARRARSRRVA